MAEMVELLDMASARAPRATIFKVARSLSLLAAGRGEEVRSNLGQQIQECWLDVNRDSVWLAIGGLFAEIVRALQEPEHARTVIDHLAPYAGRIAVTGLGRASLGPVDRFLGVALSVTGDRDGAVRHLRAAIDLAGRSGALAHEARARHDLARVLSRSDVDSELSEADELRVSAEALAESIGLVLDPMVSMAVGDEEV